MTAGLPAVSGLYGNNFNMQKYYNDPCFLQAYNSPNYNQMYGQQQMYGQSPMFNQQMYGQQATMRWSKCPEAECLWQRV